MRKKLFTVMSLALAMTASTYAQNAPTTLEEGGTGPYKAVMYEVEGLAEHTIFAPADLSAFSEKNAMPVLVWGNGGCANSPRGHENFLNDIASYGYLVLATGTMPKEGAPRGMGGMGSQSRSEQQVESMDWAFAQNADPASPFYQKIDTKHICISGMSCGGLQALTNCFDPRVTSIMICNSGLIVQPEGGAPAMGAPAPGSATPAVPATGSGAPRVGGGAPGGFPGGPGMRPGGPRMGGGGAPRMGGMPSVPKEKLQDIHCPIIYILGGDKDIAYNNGMDDYKRISHVPAIAVNLPVGHGGTYSQPHGGEFAIVARAWLDWQLKGDQQAAKMFCGDSPAILQRPDWTLEKNDKVK